MITATITTKGQITVPKAIRDTLGLKEGYQVVFVIEGKRAYLHPVRSSGVKGLRWIAGAYDLFRVVRLSERRRAVPQWPRPWTASEIRPCDRRAN